MSHVQLYVNKIKLADILFMTVVVSNKIGNLLVVYITCNVE